MKVMKKALSLLLAVSLMVSLFTIGASARTTTKYQGKSLVILGDSIAAGFGLMPGSNDMFTQIFRMPHGEFVEKSWAIYSSSMRFFDLPDCFELTKETMERWGFQKPPTRQMKLELEGERLKEVLDFFADKKDSTDDYVETLAEFLDEEEEEEA